MCTAALVLVSTGCDVEQTEEGRLPDVDVEVSGDAGALPAYDVDAPEVDVQMEEKQIEVPDVDVDVDTEDATIEVPDVDVTLPEDKE